MTDMLSVDFVVELSESSGHDTIIMVVDAVSKRVHFIPTHTTVTVEGVAWLFLYYIWKLHSLPKCVVSDCRSQFVALFTKELYRLLGIQISSSTAWHPQTDGQMEYVNQELDHVTNFIWPYLHQFFNYSHGLNVYGKPLKRPFDRYQSRLEAISIGQDIRQINW